MENTKTSVFSNGLIWFGAAVSIAEIMAGTFIAPLGFEKGFLAILLGHVLGCCLLYLAGLIGAKTGRCAMDTVKMAFGEKGAGLFSVLNILQLIGWTAVMILSGAAAANTVLPLGQDYIWSLIIGALIMLWVLVGFNRLKWLNIIAMSALFIVTLLLSSVVFKTTHLAFSGGHMDFGLAVELSAAMPLSWLPLISDYTRTAKQGKTASWVSALVYFIVSTWMYCLGMGAVLFTGESDISKIMLSAGLGTAGLIIIIFSTVTTTFLDVYSAGVSSESLLRTLKIKPTAITVTFLGTLLAILTPIAHYESFLYFIGSVFAPMIAILLVDYFVLHHDASQIKYNPINLVVWLFGFVLYRILLTTSTVIGSTLPVMVITGILCITAHKLLGGSKHV